MNTVARASDETGDGERFRLLVESVKDYGIFILSPEGRIESWNAGAERLNGYSAREIVGEHFSIFHLRSEIDAGKCDHELAVARKEGRYEEEGWRLRKDGTRFWANVTITALHDDLGNVVGFAKVTRDLTERRAAEEETRRFRLLVESVKDYGIFILSPEGRIETWNVGAERLNGYTAREIIGRHFSIFYPRADVEAGKCEHELEVAARAGRFEEEGWRIRKDGSRFWSSVTITAIRDQDGTLVGFAKVTRDLSDRRATEEEARRFRLLVESVKDYGIFILSPEGNISTWNVGAERLKGYSADEILGKHFSIFYPREDVEAGKCEYELDVASKEGRFEEEGWRVKKDGTLFWANVTITALFDPAGGLVGFAKVTRDLTERRNAELRLRELAAERAALAEKQHTQEFQERFLAILGHDLRNPLAAIEMGAALLRQTADPSSARILDKVDASTRRMARMIEQILDLTRSRLGGSLSIERAESDLLAAVTTTIDELAIAHPTRKIDLRAPSAVPGRWDRDRLEQVFSNLMGNAVQYGSADRPITVTVEDDGELIVVDVHNYGPPIERDAREKLFDPFRRGDRESRSRATAGLGLGLYISRELVRAHGGDIVIESSESAGTTFRVTLPRTPDSSNPTPGES